MIIIFNIYSNKVTNKKQYIYFPFVRHPMQKYKTIKTLGDGAFGTVYKATDIKTGQIVAIKKMKQKYTNWNQCIELRQIKCLRKFNHPNVMKLKEVLLVSEELYMVFQYLDYNLYEVYAKMKQNHKSFTEAEIKLMIFQIVSGLAHMHKNGFFHRDLKPENLLIYNNVVKLCDFGLVRQIRSRPPFTDYVSTRWYRAPQLLLRSTSYNSPVDIFALGCIMAQFYTQTPLFPGNNELDQMNKIVKILGTPDKNDWPEGYKLAQAKNYYFPPQPGINLSDIIPNASPEAIDLIQSMLRYSSRKRPTATQILKHQFFQGLTLPNIQQPSKQVLFEQQPKGAKLDTVKLDKNIDVFRVTKQKFKQTRRHQADQNNPIKQYETMNNSKMISNHNDFNTNPKKVSKVQEQQQDLDSILKQLEQKGKKKKKEGIMSSLPVLPNLVTKQKFYTYKPDKKQSKAQIHTQPLKYYEKEKKEWRNNTNQQNLINKKENLKSLGDKNFKSQPQINKFAYSFQPSINLNNIFIPSIKSPPKDHLHINSIFSKPKSLISGPYKY